MYVTDVFSVDLCCNGTKRNRKKKVLLDLAVSYLHFKEACTQIVFLCFGFDIN